MPKRIKPPRKCSRSSCSANAEFRVIAIGELPPDGIRPMHWEIEGYFCREHEREIATMNPVYYSSAYMFAIDGDALLKALIARNKEDDI